MTVRLSSEGARSKLFALALLLPVGLVILFPLQDSRPLSFESQYEEASRLFSRGYLEKSQNAARNAFLRSQTADPIWAARFQLLEAQSMVWRGLYDDAEHILESNPPTPDDPERAILRLTLEAVSLTRLQRLSSADLRLSEAAELCLQNIVKACGEVPRARGILAIQRGDFVGAKAFFFESLQHARSHNDQWLEATALLNLGTASLQQEHYDEASDWYRSASRAAVALQAEDLAQRSLGNLGWAYFELGDPTRALDLILDAQHHASALGNFSAEVSWLTMAGDVYWRIGEFVRATQSYSQALVLAKQIESKEDIVNTLEDLAHASIDAGKLKEADGYLQKLEPLLRANGNRLDALDVTLAQARIAAANHNNTSAESLSRIVEKDPASQTSMRLTAEHELARLYESEGRTADADRMYRTSLETFEAARAELKSDDSKLPFLANATGVYDDYIHFLVVRGKTDEALALADRSRARTLEQGLGVNSDARSFANIPLHPGEIARKTNATLLFYWLGERESYLWAITPAKTSMFTLPARSKIEPMVERYRKTLLGLSDPLKVSNGDGVALFQTLVAPARELIRPGSTVMILDDGTLSQLNFETLIAPAAGSALLHRRRDTHFRAITPDARVSEASRARIGNKLLLVGDAISPNPDYPELPKAATEMKQIEQHFSRSDETIFAREGATAGSYLSSAPQQFAYIHFVAHGVASRTDPLDSSIILSRSTAEEDSFKLHARDIMQHPIRARLVTISACYGSGTRSYVGEGTGGPGVGIYACRCA